MTDKRIEPSSKLYLRLANQQDLPLLRDMRKECGWGVEKLEKQFGSDDWSFCIFLKEIGGETHEVGMGGWCLDNPRDQGLASRLDRTVYLSESIVLDSSLTAELRSSFGISTSALASAPRP